MNESRNIRLKTPARIGRVRVEVNLKAWFGNLKRRLKINAREVFRATTIATRVLVIAKSFGTRISVKPDIIAISFCRRFGVKADRVTKSTRHGNGKVLVCLRTRMKERGGKKGNR